ncbi:hypothetical protein I6B79_07395 [Staphylococcus aureus]|nr:hypothetical protein [Staphylococcus aureus]MBH4603021.1 hypothetical protein [Staphylococcus aureus]MBH4613473.1 hypothetical protein [Staphylococcus aureus]
MTVVEIRSITGRSYYATTNLTFRKYSENILSGKVFYIRVKDTLDKTSWVKTDAIESITLIEES